MRARMEVGVLVIGVVLALFTGWAVFFTDLGTTTDDPAAGAADGASSSWVVVDQGTPLVSSSPRPAGSPSASPTVMMPVQRTGTATPGPSGDCSGQPTGGKLGGLTVEPGAGTADVTWYNPGDPSLVEYRLTAMPQIIVTGQQPDLDWQTVEPGEPCREITVTVTGLDREAPYMFSLDAVSKAYNTDGNRTTTIARSLVVYTT